MAATAFTGAAAEPGRRPRSHATAHRGRILRHRCSRPLPWGAVREAIVRFGRASLRVDLARARLLYGEWLRRQRRGRDARDQPGRAYQIFDSIGAAAFAGRARIELRATGGQQTIETPDSLTAQEALIARPLAGEGASNPEIAAQLFISPATCHLPPGGTAPGYQDAFRHRVMTINPGGCAPERSDHSVDVRSQTSVCCRARRLTGPSAPHRDYGSLPASPGAGARGGVQAAEDDDREPERPSP